MTFQKYLDGFVVPDPCISIVVAAAEEVTAAETARAQKRQERRRRTRAGMVIVFPAAAIAMMIAINLARKKSFASQPKCVATTKSTT
jgi:hypothetical protein